jgi:GNAT superfamily N-acetyltransferase
VDVIILCKEQQGAAQRPRPLAVVAPPFWRALQEETTIEIRQVLEFYDRVRRDVTLFDWQREDAPPVVRHIYSDGSAMITYADLQAENADQAIQAQVAYFERLGAELTWLVYDHDRPPDLKERLLAHGFDADEPETTLVLDLRDPPSGLLDPVQADVRRVDDPEGLDAVVRINERAFDREFHGWREQLERRLTISPHGLRIYVACVDGQPVSTAQLSMYAGQPLGGIIRAATLPEYRGRGLFTALVATIVQEAMRRGQRFIDADANEMSRPILERLGFQPAMRVQAFTREPGGTGAAA